MERPTIEELDLIREALGCEPWIYAVDVRRPFAEIDALRTELADTKDRERERSRRREGCS
jgi:hypothetical protein